MTDHHQLRDELNLPTLREIAKRIERFLEGDWGSGTDPIPLLRQAALALLSASEAREEAEAKVFAYEIAHETANELGFPSLTEALEALDDLQASEARALQAEGRVSELEKLCWANLNTMAEQSRRMARNLLATNEIDVAIKDTQARLSPNTGGGDFGAPSSTSSEAQRLNDLLEQAKADRDDYRDRLHDLVMIDGEERATGGGPGFRGRCEAAWTRAREPFEP